MINRFPSFYFFGYSSLMIPDPAAAHRVQTIYIPSFP